MTAIWVPLSSLLLLRSSEAETVLCQRGHVMGAPYVCEDGCRPYEGQYLVKHALPFKDPARAEMISVQALTSGEVPLQTENGYLVDGHHRVAAAVHHHVGSLPTVAVNGVLRQQRRFHARVRAAAIEGGSL